MKRILFTIFSSIVLLGGYSQNLLHYAQSANGEVGECLFPKGNDGKVFFSDIISFPHAADSIIMAADNFMMKMNIMDGYRIESVSSSPSMKTYSVQLEVGKQNWGIEHFGSPLFIIQRDASHVKFKCVIEAKQGRYKYSMLDFETNRNTIRGEAKNDGDPNIIHWQRVNSLTKERDQYIAKHDPEKRQSKEIIYDYNSQIAYESSLYLAEYAAFKRIVDGLAHLNFFEDDFEEVSTADSDNSTVAFAQGTDSSILGNVFFSHSSIDQNTPAIAQPVDLSDYHGFLLGKGNQVYVTSGEPDYEIAGAQELIKQISIDGFWTPVNRLDLAHFVIEYHVNLEGRDKAYVTIHDPQNNLVCSKTWTKGASESVNENREVARSLYLDSLLPLQQMIEKGKFPKYLEIFNIE